MRVISAKPERDRKSARVEFISSSLSRAWQVEPGLFAPLPAPEGEDSAARSCTLPPRFALQPSVHTRASPDPATAFLQQNECQ